MKALITGISGQDGYYLAEQLLHAGHEVFGLVHESKAAPDGVTLIAGDLREKVSLIRALREVEPDEIYNLAAVTAPGGAWGTYPPPGLVETTGLGVVNLLEAVRKVCRHARVVHASSSAIHDPHRYGLYGISKRFAHDAVVGYRTGHGLHVSNAVLYSHTSPRQDPRFLAPTICRTLAAGEQLTLTDLLGRRDWGYAPDHMRALSLIARAETPADVTVATGVAHSVRDFVDIALDAAGLTWDAVQTFPGNPAPRETPANTAAIRELGWKPRTTFEQMVREMVACASPQ